MSNEKETHRTAIPAENSPGKDAANEMKNEASDYRTRIVSTLATVGQKAWDELVFSHEEATPFLSYAFLHALHESRAACVDTGWQPQFVTLWKNEVLHAALPLYVKTHSYGEYVFDWAWAQAYEQHGLDYYPKLLSAIPFTPVGGPRLLARNDAARHALLETLVQLQRANALSSTHVLLTTPAEAQSLQAAGFLIRDNIQFHWENRGYADFDAFLAALERKRRKNIRAERRQVREAGVQFRALTGAEITQPDWAFFKRCYDQTYAEHRSSPYLNLDFFLRIGETMAQQVLLVIAERNGQRIASSLSFYDERTLFGRYWGALETLPCLHFETAYYQPLEFCIARGITHFEGGAQGEHKMMRGFMPRVLPSAHWLSHPAFSNAVEHFISRERSGLAQYLEDLNARNPFHDSPFEPPANQN